MNQSSICTKIVDKDFRSIPKIILRTREEGGTKNFALPYRRLIFDIQIYRLSIPCNDIIDLL